MKTSIIILTDNQLECTQNCLKNIQKYTEPAQYEIIIVANKSTDETVEWLGRQSDLKVIYNEQIVGFPQGYNQGIALATGDNILLLRNDVVVTDGWLSNLINCLYSQLDIGAVAPITNIGDYYQARWVDYKNMEEMQVYAKNHNQPNPLVWEERLKLTGCCMLIKKNIMAIIGGLDEQFTPGGLRSGCSIRIRLAGYQTFAVQRYFVHNSGHPPHNQDNRHKFVAKWGFDPVYSTFIRQEIIDLIDKPHHSPLNILEIGCACGGTLLQIKNIYKNAKLAGIEFNEQAAVSAKMFADVIAADIEKTALPYPPEHFDYIILADVLEHLVDPWQALENIQPFLKPDGQILASIPNVMHFSVIRSLPRETGAMKLPAF